jgi:hypothetical protein
MNLHKHPRWLDAVLVVGAPLSLAILELFHPHANDLLKVDVQTWLVVHYLQILLFPLVAVAMVVLVRGRRDIAAALCRVGAFIFGASYIAFDTAAGVVTGILVKAAHVSGSPDAWRAPLDVVWTHPIMGGSPSIPAPFLAVLGSVALSVAAVAAAVSLKRDGSSWGSVVLLSLSSFGIAIFKTHAWPGGPLTFGGLAIASAWLWWERAQRASAGIGSDAQHDAAGDAR